MAQCLAKVNFIHLGELAAMHKNHINNKYARNRIKVRLSLLEIIHLNIFVANCLFGKFSPPAQGTRVK